MSEQPAAEDRDVLSYNLWGADDTPYRVLRNRMVVTRQLHDCDICFGAIPAGSRVRAQAEVFDGVCKTFYVCPTCCEAFLADRRDGDCLHMEERTRIGMERQAPQHLMGRMA